jgi:hypothetical protein
MAWTEITRRQYQRDGLRYQPVGLNATRQRAVESGVDSRFLARTPAA